MRTGTTAIYGSKALLRGLRSFARARTGGVAVEAAIIIPLLILGTVAVIDTVRFIGTAARLDRVAATAADLTARSDIVVDQVDFENIGANNELAMFFFSANQVAEPDNIAEGGRIILSAVQPTAGSHTVLWQRSGPYGLTIASRLGDLPQLPVSGTHVVAEVFFRFQPIVLQTLGVLAPADLVLYRRAVFRPRRTALTTLSPLGG